MAKDYKLCPNCNNALDKDEIKCPYCWNSIMFNNFWANDTRIEQKESTVKNKNSWCWGCIWCFVFFFFLAVVVFMIFVELSFREASDSDNSLISQINDYIK